MEVNGAVPALAGTVTFTGISSIALLGSFFILVHREEIGEADRRVLLLHRIEINR
jgi:hypothetical protein